MPEPDAIDHLIEKLELDSEFANRFDRGPIHGEAPKEKPKRKGFRETIRIMKERYLPKAP